MKMYSDQELRLIDGRLIEILSVGIPSPDNGDDLPEFFGASFRLIEENIELHGSIKIDINSVDWYFQKTVASAQFDNVILHVVTNADTAVMLNNRIVPTLVIKVSDEMLDYRHTIAGHCKRMLCGVEEVYVENFMSRLATDRIERKSKEVIEVLISTESNWQRTTLITIMRSFGYGEIKIALETLARNLSFYILCTNATDLQSIEALLFGHSGHLEGQRSNDPYYFDLQQKYLKLCKSYKIPSFSISWHTSHVRPCAIAELQIARIAAVFFNNVMMFDKLIKTRDYKVLRKMFTAQLSPYWQNHSSLGIQCNTGVTQMTSDKIDLILINGVIPLLYAFGAVTHDTDTQEWAMNLLYQISPEKNSKVRVFEAEGYFVKNSYYSQALIQLYDAYCKKAQCDKCPLGSYLINQRYQLYMEVRGFRGV